jgi:hypothetical protein
MEDRTPAERNDRSALGELLRGLLLIKNAHAETTLTIPRATSSELRDVFNQYASVEKSGAKYMTVLFFIGNV